MTRARTIALLDRAAALLSRHGYDDTAADLRELQAEVEQEQPEALHLSSNLSAVADPRRPR